MFNPIMIQILRGVYWVLNIASGVIVIRAVLSWFMRPDMPIYAFLIRVSEPLIAPFRPLAYRLTNGRLPIDLAPLFAYFALIILQRLVAYGMMFFMY